MRDGGGCGRPEVFAELHGNPELGQRVTAEELVAAEGHVVGDELRRHGLGASCGKEALLGMGERALGHDAHDLALRQHERAVVELGTRTERRAHDGEHVKVLGSLGDLQNARLSSVDERVLPEEVSAGSGRKAQLGQHDDLGSLPRGLPDLLDATLHVERHVCHAHLRHAGGNSHEPVVHGSSFGPKRVDHPIVALIGEAAAE